MRRDLDYEYSYIPRTKKVKHVKYFYGKTFSPELGDTLTKVESDINKFADSNPGIKILGVRTNIDFPHVVASVTYLEDVPGQFTTEDYDDTDD